MNFHQLERQYLIPSYPCRGLTLVRGEGVYLYDEKGDRYLDMMSNYGVNILGHSHPEITKTAIRQVKKLANLHGSFTSDQRSLAARELVQRCGIPGGKVFWSNSGSEAIEAALKFAVLATGKKKFIAAKEGYHGKTLGALSATGGKKYRQPFEPLIWEFNHLPFNDFEAIKDAVDDQTAAVILEPIPGEAGIIIPYNKFLNKIRQLCDEKKVLLILDEIQTGTGRTGRFLAAQYFDIVPDIICLGKGLAAGFPVGATVVKRKVAVNISRLMHTNTFGGNPLTMAVVRSVLRLLDNKFLARIEELGRYFVNRLNKIKSQQIIDIRGRGLMIGVEVKGKHTPILKALQQQKILAIPAAKNVVRFLPPYIIDKAHIDDAVRALRCSMM